MTGIKVIHSIQCADRVQFRFPRSGKKRIRNKWAKRQENYRTVLWKHLYKLPDGTLIGHPETVARLVRALEATKLSWTSLQTL